MSYNLAHTHYHMIRMKEMGRVFWCHSFGAAGVGLISVFTSIFLLKNGYDLTSVLELLCLQQVFSLLVFRAAAGLMSIVTPNQMLGLGSIFYIIFIGFLSTTPRYHWSLAFLAALWSLNRTTYWTAFHYLFSLSRGHTHGGRQIAALTAFITLASTVAPAIGGIIATSLGITYTYILASIILVIAIAPLYADKTGPEKVRFMLSHRDIRAMRPDLIAQFFYGIAAMADQNIWPIFVFLLVSSYAGIGALSTAIAVASVILTLYVGRKQEVNGERTYIRRGVATSSMANALRLIAHTTAGIFGINLLTGVGRALYVTPYMNRYYHNADGAHRLGYVMAMETAFTAGGATHMLTLVLLSLLVSTKVVLIIGFIIAAFSIGGLRYIR